MEENKVLLVVDDLETVLDDTLPRLASDIPGDSKLKPTPGAFHWGPIYPFTWAILVTKRLGITYADLSRHMESDHSRRNQTNS